MRIFVFALFMSAASISVQAGQTYPLFGSEASGVVEVKQITDDQIPDQQASIDPAPICADQTCPMPIKTAKLQITGNTQP